MSNQCIGTCTSKHETLKIHKDAYKMGYRWCSVCCLFIKFSERLCPCCKHQLRRRSWQGGVKEAPRI